jgi:hypothetical protein
MSMKNEALKKLGFITRSNHSNFGIVHTADCGLPCGNIDLLKRWITHSALRSLDMFFRQLPNEMVFSPHLYRQSQHNYFHIFHGCASRNLTFYEL